MDIAKFRASIERASPPVDLGAALQALWWDAKGNWRRAHECAQAQEDAAGAWVHAYLHRKEGDSANAGYWYRRAGKPAATQPLETEWETILAALLSAAS
jgi:hypothetical protein